MLIGLCKLQVVCFKKQLAQERLIDERAEEQNREEIRRLQGQVKTLTLEVEVCFSSFHNIVCTSRITSQD